MAPPSWKLYFLLTFSFQLVIWIAILFPVVGGCSDGMATGRIGYVTFKDMHSYGRNIHFLIKVVIHWPCSNWSSTQNLSSDPPYYGQLWYIAIEKLSVQYEWTTSHQRNLISSFWAEMAWCAFLRGPLSHVDDILHPLLGVDCHEEELWIDRWLDGMMRLQMHISLDTYHHLRLSGKPSLLTTYVADVYML
jgi:hypothetical protein